MQKKDTLNSKSSSDSYKCGECLHYASHPLRSKNDLCKNEGIRHFANAPKCFTPDVTKIGIGSDQLIQVVSIFNNFTHKQRRLLVAVLKGRQKKFKFGTKLYFRAVGQDYISNYLCGFVLGSTSGGEIILGGDPDKTRRGSSYTAIFKSTDDLLTTKQWFLKKKSLVSQGRIEDPKQPLRKFPRKIDPNLYEPKTMDTAPAAWFNKEKEDLKKSTKRKKTEGIKDVVDILRIR